MSDQIQRLRRDLASVVADPVWPPGVSARAFDAADAAAVHRLMQIAYASGGGGVGGFDQWWPGVRDDGDFDADLCFLAVDGRGEIVGAAQCWTSGFIKDLVVHPRARRQGIAEALLLAAFQAFRRRGAACVDLKVQLDNPSGAARLYRRLGMRDAPIDG